MRAVSVEATCSHTSARAAIRRPLSPVITTVKAPEFPCSLESGADVPALARGGKTNHNVSRSAQGFQLAFEYFAETAVVRDGGHHRRVGGKCDGGQRVAIAAEAPHKLGRQMLRIGGAATVPTPQDLIAMQQTFRHANGGALEGFLLRIKLADNGEMFVNSAGKQAGQVP